MTIKICEKHHSKATWKAAGVSKSTGKPYPGFWACSERDGDGYCRANIIDSVDGEEWLDAKDSVTQKSEDETQAMWAEKSRRIERQHSQSAAIEFLKLRFDIDPDSFKKAIEKTDLRSMVKTYTDFFADDIEKKETFKDEVTYEPVDDAEIERISKAIDV